MQLLKPHDPYYFWRMARPANVGIAIVALAAAAWGGQNWQADFLLHPTFWLEAFCLACIMVGGYWINDVYDFKIDRVNKPDRAWVNAFISRKKVLTAYFSVNAGITALCLLLPWPLAVLNLAAILGLQLYAMYFKRYAVVGNLVIATLTALVVVQGGLLTQWRWPLLWMASFAFGITFIREVVKDVEDIRGDILYGLRTLPIQAGLRTTKRVLAFSYGVMLLAVVAPVAVEWLRRGVVLWPYALAAVLAVQLPLIYLISLLRKAVQPREYRRQSQWLKLTTVAGLLVTLLLRDDLAL